MSRSHKATLFLRVAARHFFKWYAVPFDVDFYPAADTLVRQIPSAADRRGDTYQELETRLSQLRKIDYALSEISHHCQDVRLSPRSFEFN